jgi:hypothetical protein
MQIPLIHVIAAGAKSMVVVLFVFMGWTLFSDWMSDHWDFSPWRWRVVARDSREHMARDYLATHVAPGMHVSQVVTDLGQPSWTTDQDEGLEGERLVYTVSRHRMFFGDKTTSIYFDTDEQGLITASGFR